MRTVPTVSSTTCATASDTGRCTVNRVPRPGVDSRSMRPPIAATSARTTSMPTPRPAIAVTEVAVEKPGLKISSPSSRSPGCASAGIRPRSIARSRMRP